MRPTTAATLGLAVLGWAACSDPKIVGRPAYLALSTDLVDFGPVTLGESAQRTVFVINKGDLSLTVGTPEGDLLGGVFSVVGGDMVLGADGDTVLRVSFSPSSATDYETTLVVPNDSVNQPEIKVRLLGRGVSSDPCWNKACDVPPARYCLRSTTSRGWDPRGRCLAGRCEFDPVDEECPTWGCDEQTGRCRGDPCANKPCNVPPARTCVTSTQSQGWNPASGRCVAGECLFDSVTEDCTAFGCNATTGACNPDPCQGVSCQTPTNACYSASGRCVGGGCVYDVLSDIDCDDGNACTLQDVCREGACRGTAKACNTPPAPSCASDGRTLRTPASAGTCGADGGCTYPVTETNCEFGCTAGGCRPDPCAGGCNDGNPCTVDSCRYGVGCEHVAAGPVACTASSGKCPQGHCAGTTCVSDANVTCQATYDVDLCQEATIAGVCTAAGECVVQSVPPEYRCAGCNGICLKCYIIQVCLPI